MRKPQRGYVIAAPTELPENGKTYLFLGYLMTPSQLHMLYTVSILDYVVSLIWSLVKEELEGCDCGIIRVLSQHSPGGIEENHGKPQSEELISRPRFELGISRMWFSVLYHNAIPSVSHVDITDDDKLKNIKVGWPVVAVVQTKFH
jgi:hypothetical protein